MQRPFLVSLLFLVLAFVPTGHGIPGPLAKDTYTERPPIEIEGDAFFTPANGVVRGLGTVDNPFIIEGWRIDLGGLVGGADAGSGPLFSAGIHVAMTTKHFRIVNCEIVNGDAKQNGIVLTRVSHATINHTRVVSNTVGIVVDRSSDVRIESSNLSRNRESQIVARDTVQLWIIDNEIQGGLRGNGIALDGVEEAVVQSNLVQDQKAGDAERAEPAILVKHAPMALVAANRIVGNGDLGLVVELSRNVTVQDNHIERNGDIGIVLSKSDGARLLGNLQSGSVLYGAYLHWTNHSTVRDNVFRNNRHGAFAFTNGSLIQANAFDSNRDSGLTLQGNGNQIVGNAASRNQDGIIIGATSRENVIRGNVVDANTAHGILLYARSYENTVVENQGSVTASADPPLILSGNNPAVFAFGLLLIALVIYATVRLRSKAR